ncbi:Gfo/Idh/MocA family protein [Vibrio nitrifigilis]|uniref:Gfo/Idh/MocA family oxidoreductase n=1 Tax=Vibrio nitrifigilis TaxID=2789781 RepID=A0ABS0GFL8_9VIBR|nr:Gfo/Idh/MocA family oxidoreductase [Vibrio nitrifigilis]MBF9001160.1 Gfo/Idh/MocA family oxidoreductase [Vibrio nitrifigilis]
MKKKLKIAFLGGGVNSAIGRTHKIAISMDEKFDLVAGCFSKNEQINRESAAIYGVDDSRVYATLDELIKFEKNNIDLVSILTPTPNHKDDVIKCIESGIKVVCEKALCQSVQDALEIKNKLEEYNGFLAVTYNYTGYPIVRELRDMILGGDLGKIEQIHIEMPQESYSKVDESGSALIPQDWRLHDIDLPKISLDLGTHIHDLTRFLTQEQPIELVALQNSFGSFPQVVDNVLCIAKYSNNIVSNIWFSKCAIGYRNGLKVRVFGSKGSASWTQMNPEILNVSYNNGQKNIIDRALNNNILLSEERYNR